MAKKKEETRVERPKFEFYKINIRKATQTEAFKNGANLSAHDALKKIFGPASNQLELYTEANGGTRYHNRVLQHDRDIVLLRLHNDKEVPLTAIDDSSSQGYKERIEHDYPPCHLVIDNREGSEHVAIERTKGWGKTTRAKDVLEEALNSLLKPYEWAVEIKPITLFMEFEEYKRQRTEEGLRMSTITVKILNPDEYTNLHLPEKTKGIIRQGVDNCRRYELLYTSQTMCVNTKRNMKPQAMRTLTEALGVAFENGFDTSVAFSSPNTSHNDTTYRNGAAPAVFEMNSLHLLNFQNGQMETHFEDEQTEAGQTYGIEFWLQTAYDKIAQYKKDEQVRQKPKRNRKRRVS